MAFTDAHSGSSVCTPTRYGILTGRFAWRSSLESGVLGGYSPRLIEEGRLTVPAPLRKHGYHTACVGKQGRWKPCLCPGSGGWSKPRPGKEDQGLPPVQLYDRGHDPGEATNLQANIPRWLGD